MSFIDLVLSSTSEYEAPRRFYYWAALSAVSAVLKDNVYFDMAKAYKLYPNIYVLLYGPSGVRKGPAIALAEKVVKRVDNTRVINGRSSIEAIIKELGTFTTRKGKDPLKDASGFVVASELSSSIISNPSAMDIMTNLYDRIWNEGEWKYKLKVGESHTLNNPTITWLSGTNEALFKDFVPEKNIHGGLIGRMFMVSETKPHRLNSLMFNPQIVPNYDDMASLLFPISQLKGEFEMDVGLREEIDKWYINFRTTIEPQLMDETGFVPRILDFIMKNAMLIAAGRRAELLLKAEDIKEAMEVTLPLIVPTKRASQALKKVDPSKQEQRGLVLHYLANCEGATCSRQTILKNLGLKLDHEDLDKVITLMLQMNVVSVQSLGGEVVYKLNLNKPEVAKYVEQFRR